MKILIVDDMEERHVSFRLQLSGHELWHVYDGLEAADVMLRETFDVMYLDHDLADEHYDDQKCERESIPDRPMDGRDVARLVISLPEERRPKCVVVHSWNVAGARAMMAILMRNIEKIYRMPFSCYAMDVPTLP